MSEANQQSKPTKKTGRRCKYSTHVEPRLDEIESWAFDGYTDEEIYHSLKISRDTYYKFLKQFPEFSESIKRGKSFSDYQVEQELYRRAVGYEYEEEEVIEGGQVGKQVKKTKKHMPSNPLCIFYWLNNRKGHRWKKKSLRENSMHSTVEQVKEVWERFLKGDVDVVNTAHCFSLLGVELPQSVKIHLENELKLALEQQPQSKHAASDFDYDALEADAKAADDAIKRQKEEFVPQRKQELEAIKNELGYSAEEPSSELSQERADEEGRAAL